MLKKDKLKDMASDAKDKTEDIGRTIINKSIDASNNFSEVVKANPYKSLTIAFLCGWVIAKL